MGRPGLPKNRKFLRLTRALQAPCGVFAEHVARGCLETLWDNAYENGEDFIGDAADVEAAAKWTGEPGLLCRALAEAGGEGRAGFIEEIPDQPGQYLVHDLYDHAPAYVRKRMAREAERRATGKTISDLRREAARMRGKSTNGSKRTPFAAKQDRDGRPPAPAPAPAPTQEKEQKPRARENDPPGAAAAWDLNLLNELRVAFRVTELTDRNFADFLASSLRFPKPQREEAARAFIERGCASSGKSYGYLLGMIRGAATRDGSPTKPPGQDASGSPIPDADETQRMLAELRGPKNPPPRLRGAQ